ncbi:dolichyl-phosphate-mannose--protein mannosyltransferase 4 [Zygosaccharomyces mellis]|uniref:Dolichyl-phosphate-mannose--protein mannosyltransferase n=1 Tax=Zygosaccharomyces mellis TaxID=42258 RepID=A0A4C2E3S7_9SACH|nr:dolichyl-phosphate-mannose--protein mannosyltransferase 4 [Zygosaccharomyces mellis]
MVSKKKDQTTINSGNNTKNSNAASVSKSKSSTPKSSGFSFSTEKWLLRDAPDTAKCYSFWLWAVTCLAFFVRFYKIWYPKEVVFDEVHFGKFASYYLERSFFFDVHPPLAKMLIAFIGFLSGYDGSFKFDEIGHSYVQNPAPFLQYRCFNAFLGTMTVPLMFNTLKEFNFKAITCAFGAFMVAIDNAHVTETRLILLDAFLNFTVALSVYSYVKFYKVQLTSPFSLRWNLWLFATGLSLSLVISTKYIGVMTYAMIGSAVAINLWQLLDVRAGLTVRQFASHVVKRLNGLIFAPFLVYLFWFWIHFAILTKSGPGDNFMSGEFQETLGDSPLAKESRQVNYYDIITLRHRDTNGLLHSHLSRYPQRYEDGRISSQGQQVTCYFYEDANNEWEIVPVKDLPSTSGQPVLLNEAFRLRHVMTNSYLLTHDVASPYYPTNEEVVTVSEEEANGPDYQQTLFTFQGLNKRDAGSVLKSKGTLFRIFHVDTAVALWTHNDVLLPDWGFHQQEVNGNKKVTDTENNWFVDTIVNIDEERKAYVPKEVKKLPFFTKWAELQRLMFEHNNKLSADHPFASQPYSWPGSMNGVSFWTKDSERKQIFFIGNIIGWWLQVISLATYSGIVIADLFTRQRAYYALGRITREKLYGPLMYFFIGWGWHYFPFYLMGRQRFLHHYLPAQLIASMFTAALWEVIFSDCKSLDTEKDEELPDANYNDIPEIQTKILYFFFGIMAVTIIWCFWFFSPFVYGNVSLTPDQVVARKWLNMELNFAK